MPSRNDEIWFERFGPRNCPLLTIVTGVHGDERAPISAAKKLIEHVAEVQLKAGLQVIFANPAAIDQNLRFVDKDLNRCFPGSGVGSYEERLAVRLRELVRDSMIVVDFHSLKFDMEPYGVVSIYNERVRQSLIGAGLANNLFDNSECLIKFVPRGFAIEVGNDSAAVSEQRAFELMLRLLKFHGVLACEPEVRSAAECNIFLIYHFLRKCDVRKMPENLADFRLVTAGELVGYDGEDKPVFASENFYPLCVGHPLHVHKCKKIEIYE